MPVTNVDWDNIPDDELFESYWERVHALKDMFPKSVRSRVSHTIDWSWWMTKKTFSFTKSAIWIGSTSAALMLLPVVIERELADMAKSQILQQQQMLLGTPTIKP